MKRIREYLKRPATRLDWILLNAALVLSAVLPVLWRR